MFRSLHMKLVLILVLMIVSVMAVVGTFLINSVSTFYIDSFYEDMQNVFNQTDVMQSLENAAQAGTTDIQTVVDSYEGQLGIDNYRTYYILDSQGRVLASSNALREASFTGPQRPSRCPRPTSGYPSLPPSPR